jgi:hypothetical protein
MAAFSGKWSYRSYRFEGKSAVFVPWAPPGVLDVSSDGTGTVSGSLTFSPTEVLAISGKHQANAGAQPDTVALTGTHSSGANYVIHGVLVEGAKHFVGSVIATKADLTKQPDGTAGTFSLVSLAADNASVIRFTDVKKYLDAIADKSKGDIDSSPHGAFWQTDYKSFIGGTAAGVSIIDTANPVNSAFYVILTKGFAGNDQMPAGPGGPYITDPGYTVTIDGATVTGQQISDNLKTWLQNGYPE